MASWTLKASWDKLQPQKIGFISILIVQSHTVVGDENFVSYAAPLHQILTTPELKNRIHATEVVFA